MKEILEFLRALAENNNKAWFDANRPWYEKVRASFIVMVQDTIAEIGKEYDLGDLEAKKCLFRINRDVRFSANKSPYKNNFSAAISPGGKKDDMIGLYIHIQPGESFLAGGCYSPLPEHLAAVRQEIDFNLAKLEAVIADKEFIAYYQTLRGEKLKTSPKGYDADNPAIEFLKMKQFYVSHSYSDSQIEKASLAKESAKAYRLLRPFVEYLQEATTPNV